jgi:hypothetical protein
MNTPVDNSKRSFLKKTAYVVPVILTMKVAPALAGAGSPHRPHDGDGEGGGGKVHRRHGHGNFFSQFKHAFRKLF